MAPPKRHKRSVKNLLLDKSYQLKFTMFMVAVSALLMGVLGWWVMRVADRATTVAINNVIGRVCQPPPAVAGVVVDPGAMPDRAVFDDDGDGEADAKDDTGERGDETVDDDAAGDEAGDDEAGDDEAGDDEAGDDEDRPRAAVTLDTEIEMIAVDPLTPQERSKWLASYNTCRLDQSDRVQGIVDRRDLISQVLIGLGVMIIFGLTFYGIKMTHRVAGPLFKVGLYLNKLKDGKYDTVYDLRKGDQLVEFYSHFKAAHSAMRKLQEEDLEMLKAILAAAEKEELADKSPELATILDDIKEMAEEKEESLG